LQQKVIDGISKVVIDIVAMKIILKLVERACEKDQKPVILAVHSPIAVASLFAFGLLGCSQKMKRNGNILEVLILIDIIEEACNFNANEDSFAGQRGNKQKNQSKLGSPCRRQQWS